MSEIIILLPNIRSAHNVGSILRSAEGFGVKKVIISGYTPYPKLPDDNRLPHIVNKLTNQIHKAALGAETMIEIEHQPSINFASLRSAGYQIVGLEQSANSIMLGSFSPPSKIALLLGEEVAGIDSNLLAECDNIVEIPMLGSKESFNVSVATGIALYALTVGAS